MTILRSGRQEVNSWLQWDYSLRPDRPHIHGVPRDTVPRGKADEAWSSPHPSTAEVKNTWKFTFIPQHTFKHWSLIKHMDNFAYAMVYLTALLMPSPIRIMFYCLNVRAKLCQIVTMPLGNWCLSSWFHESNEFFVWFDVLIAVIMTSTIFRYVM
jgi:hypothetical protein